MTREEAIEVYNGLINTKIKEAFEFFAPELRESEDERIRKWLIHEIEAIYVTDGIVKNENADKALAWLEKQKEMPTDEEMKLLLRTEYEKGVADTIAKYEQKEQKSKNILTYNDFLQTAYPKGQTDVLEDPEAYGLQKEQKPAVSREEILYQLLQNSSITMSDYLYLTNKQKPAEWSEENKQWLSEVYFAIDHSMYSEDERQAMKEYIDSLRSQSKTAEWSEEDEKMKERLITRLNWITYNTRTDGTSPNITFFNEIAWLKSLRPSWKPSEEQMEALESAVKLYKDTHFEIHHEKIVSLYEQLKKLM